MKMDIGLTHEGQKKSEVPVEDSLQQSTLDHSEENMKCSNFCLKILQVGIKPVGQKQGNGP